MIRNTDICFIASLPLKHYEVYCADRCKNMAPTLPSKSKEETAQTRRIVFFHPDLGIGGAERLIIDAAVGLQQLGHKVTIFTSHCDPEHCFEEARDGMRSLHEPTSRS